jgi:hypothetical protein
MNKLILIAVPCCLFAQSREIPIDPAKLQSKNVKIESVTYKGKKAVKLADAGAQGAGETLAIITGTDFQDGAIEVDLTGDTLPTAPPTSRGFTGIAFRSAPDGSKYEAFYLRPKNGRAEDQLQRNHSAQYIATPDFPWELLREKFPGKYETYVDLVPGEWTKVKIEVHGESARLYVNGAAQPTLIVNDLKHGLSRGTIALWIGPGTVAHFANLRVAAE